MWKQQNLDSYQLLETEQTPCQNDLALHAPHHFLARTPQHHFLAMVEFLLLSPTPPLLASQRFLWPPYEAAPKQSVLTMLSFMALLLLRYSQANSNITFEVSPGSRDFGSNQHTYLSSYTTNFSICLYNLIFFKKTRNIQAHLGMQKCFRYYSVASGGFILHLT